MRILFYPHDLGMGGSQMNAIELAAAVRDLGNEAIVFGRRGLLNSRIEELGLEFIESPRPGHRPSPNVVAALRRTIDRRGIDIVHGFEWPPALETALAAVRRRGTTAVATVASMAVAPFIPRTVPLLVGTEQIAAAERRAGRLRVATLEPSVDMNHNVRPSEQTLNEFRTRHGIAPSLMTIVCVSRLAHELKLEGIQAAIRAVAELARDHPLQLLIAGDGPARPEVQALAGEVNRRHGRDIVILTGELFDSRPAYAIGDITIGMGSSALRALAFERPLVVQGERGYFRLLTPDSVPEFLWTGWYGVGDGEDGAPRLSQILRKLIADPGLRAQLGSFGRRVVEERYSLTSAAQRQVKFYREAASPVGVLEWGLALVAASGKFASHLVRRQASRIVGQRATDDFNVQPVAMSGLDAVRHGRPLLIYQAGSSWDGVAGTDRKLVDALARDVDVLWVDPPISFVSLRRARDQGAPADPPGMAKVADGVIRLRVLALPGFTKPLARAAADAIMARVIRDAVSKLGSPVLAVVHARAGGAFPAGVPGRRVYYVTDDWPAGAELMGMDRAQLDRVMRRNLAAADIVAAVSPTLVNEITRRVAPGKAVHLLPNGCNPDAFVAAGRGPTHMARPTAGLVGQLNERLDVDTLIQVASGGMDILVVGPRTERDPGVVARLDEFLALPTVRYVGSKSQGELPHYFSQMKVGLTPYLDTPFNRASFPLKTLEYLAAGLAVVSTDLPATRWLGSELVTVATDPQNFVEQVRRLLEREESPDLVEARRALAWQHTWRSRAEALLNYVSCVTSIDHQ